LNETALAAQGSAAWAFAKTAGGWEPTTTTPLEDTDIEKLTKLVEDLENHDDVQDVYTNAE
jgi:transcriptional/translational regulatory protein YebC/TACO1